MIKHFSKAFLVVLSSLVLFIFASCTTTDATYSLELTTTELTMHVGDEIDMTARLLKNGEEVNETLTWVSSDTSIVTIEGAKIKAISLGRTTIKVSFKAIEKSVTVNVVDASQTNFTVSFETGSGVTIESQEIELGSKVLAPTPPTKTGHTFDGWYTDINLNNAFDFNTEVDSNLTLYAAWTIDQYTVNFITNFEVGKVDIKVNHGLKLSDNDLFIDRDTHALENWYTDSDLTKVFDKDTEITTDLTLYAKWEVRQLTIEFNTNDETLTKSNMTMNYGAMMSIGQLTIGEKAHHDFDGWYLDSDLTISFDRTIPITSDLTLYAKWVEHEITFYTIKHLIKTSSTTSDLHAEIKVENVYVGVTVTVDALNIPNLIPDSPTVEAIVKSGGKTVVEVYYGPVGYTYELEFNGGNTRYATRDEMARDWIKDYNQFSGTSYTLESLPMGSWAIANVYTFMYHPTYRAKWLWLAQYLSVVGSSTNKIPVGRLLTIETAALFEANSANNKYAVSYEFRGFIKGVKFTDNAAWQSSDYAENTLQNGFWPNLAQTEIKIIHGAQYDVTLPTNVYLPNHDFVGWYLSSNFSGEPVTVITEPTKLYAKFEEKTPVETLIITNEIAEMEKGTTYQLNVSILPLDAYNKTLIYESSDVRVATISQTGQIVALNEGEVIITVSSQNGKVSVDFNLSIYPQDDILLVFSDNFNGNIQVGQQFDVEAIGVGREASSLNYSYTVDNPSILSMSEPGVFNANLAGTTKIHIYNLETLVFSYTVIVQNEFSTSRVDQLLQILANGHNPVATGVNVIPYYTPGEEWSDPRHESVNEYLFDDFIVDRSGYRVPDGLKDSGARPTTEFILVHDTANLNGGLVAHGNFFKNTDNSVSIHYITGDYGIIQSLSDNRIGWHGGVGGQTFQWQKTGIIATSSEAPYIDLSADGYFTFNGIKSIVEAPRHTNGSILDRSYFTYLGPSWEIFDGEYYIGSTHFATTQQSRGVIATRGGNSYSVGIEMSVNRDGDIMDTVQRTAKLIANLLEQYDLDNRRVILHNSTDGKGDPYTLNNTVYKGTWYYDRFMEYVAIERNILKDFSDATITLTSTSPLVSSTGRILELPEFTTEVVYTITVSIDGVTKSIDLVTVVPGIQTWSQNFGFFKPVQAYSKSDYRND